MKRKLAFVFCFTLMLSGFVVKTAQADVEQRRVELVKVLDEELMEVVRLNKQMGSGRPDLVLRMAQILLEKGRLLKDYENQKYLDTPTAERERLNKDEVYKESRKYFEQAQKTVLSLLKNYPKYEGKADAYYILAFNAKEIKQDDQSKAYFQKALDEAKPDSLIADKARIALAEIYFNAGFFDKSQALYEAALKTKRDKWWTKDAFNLSWCYFRLGKYDKAINLMSESYELSKQAKFIDMSKSIERDLAYFYTEAGRSEEAIAFYKKNGKSISEIMLRVGRYLKTQGKFASAEKTLSDGLQFKKSEKEEIEFNAELLSLYEKYGRDQKHLEACRSLAVQFSKGTLNSDQIDVLKYNTQKMAALVQQQLVNRTYDHQPDVKEKKAAAAVEYFMISSIIVPEKAQEDYFHAGETYYAAGKFDDAIPMYSEAIKRSRKANDKKTEQLANTALMVSLGQGVKKTTLDTYLVPAYESYLLANPKGEKSPLIYQRLFSSHVEKKNLVDAEKVLISFKNNFPNESETQEKMLAQIMDYYKDSGDKNTLAAWVKRVEQKEFKVSADYASKVKLLVLGMQFENVEVASSKGDKNGALKGYWEIFTSPESDNDAKKTAAYNLAVLFYEAGDYKPMYVWADRAVNLMNSSDLVKFEKNFIIFSTDLFQRRQFVDSASLSEKVFDKLCSTDSKNKRVFFKNANVVYLSEKQFEKSKSLLTKASKCGVAQEVILAGYLDHLNELAVNNRWNSFSEIIKTLEASASMQALIIYPSSLLANEFENIGRAEDAAKVRAKMLQYYESAKKQKVDVPLEALDAIALIRLSSLEIKLKKLSADKFSFPEAQFNKILKGKFLLLDQIVAEADSIAAMGSGVGIVRAYRLLVAGHDLLKDEISNFTPAGKSAEYVKSFKKSMAKLVEPISKQAQSFRDLAKNKIEKDNILSADNGWFMKKENADFIPEFISDAPAIIMDKAGAK
jgi:tetratricopeptide (TPR) repeat protein